MKAKAAAMIEAVLEGIVWSFRAGRIFGVVDILMVELVAESIAI